MFSMSFLFLVRQRGFGGQGLGKGGRHNVEEKRRRRRGEQATGRQAGKSRLVPLVQQLHRGGEARQAAAHDGDAQLGLALCGWIHVG